MKELFGYYSFTDDEKDIINYVDSLLCNDGEKLSRYTVRQLFYSSIKDNVINSKDTPFPVFHRLMDKARLGGLLDWHCIVSNDMKTSPADIDVLKLQNRLIFMRGVYLKNWMDEEFIESNLPDMYHSSGLSWDIATLYFASSRFSYFIVKGKDVKVTYYSDYFALSDAMYKKFVRQFTRMMVIPVARYLFNSQSSDYYWHMQGLKSNNVSLNTLRRAAQKHITEAKKLVSKHAHFLNVGIRKNDAYYKDCIDGRLCSLSNKALMAMLNVSLL